MMELDSVKGQLAVVKGQANGGYNHTSFQEEKSKVAEDRALKAKVALEETHVQVEQRMLDFICSFGTPYEEYAKESSPYVASFSSQVGGSSSLSTLVDPAG
ncbi:hypothetical protein ACH5RR_012947 [Cinchona calisaya]|uniref:Uncharacterized protein n=1 Tax=Cinchona calisaya TaxID=153742 RepID=A0ABD3A1Y3_9GENT